jgi:sarcosine oxidase gamma subunit
MDELPRQYEPMEYAGLTVSVDERMQVATLRYFEPDAAFAQAARAGTGVALPQALQAREARDAQVVLAWRSPTETLCLAGSTAPLSQLAGRLAGAADGCMVDLSGGLKVVRLSGDRVSDLLGRLGGTASVPQPGEARRSRLADVPVLALSVRAPETLLVVDRTYLPHLLAWIRATLLDFVAA